MGKKRVSEMSELAKERKEAKKPKPLAATGQQQSRTGLVPASAETGVVTAASQAAVLAQLQNKPVTQIETDEENSRSDGEEDDDDFEHSNEPPANPLALPSMLIAYAEDIIEQTQCDYAPPIWAQAAAALQKAESLLFHYYPDVWI